MLFAVQILSDELIAAIFVGLGILVIGGLIAGYWIVKFLVKIIENI